jgi:predicted acylesterase/phospholipase RssA
MKIATLAPLTADELEPDLVADALRSALGLERSEASALASQVRLEHLHAGATLAANHTGALTLVVLGQLAWRAANEGSAGAIYGPGAALPLGALQGGAFRALRSVLLAHVPIDALDRLGIGGARVLAALFGTSAPPAPAPPGLIIGLSGTDPALTLELAHGLAKALERHGTVSLATELTWAHGPKARLSLERTLRPATYRLAVFSQAAGAAALPVDRWLHVVHGDRPGEGPALCEAALDGTAGSPMEFAPGTPGLGTRTLLLVHDRSLRLPRETPRHLAHHAPDAHRHLRRGEATDLARIARELAGVPVGFTFGAGGARGLAHLGVLRAAKELDVPVDHVSAASIGAIMGALVGLGLTPDAQRAMIERLVRAKPFTELALPTTALLGSRRIERLAEEVFGSADLTDLWIPLSTITCDLGDFSEHVHRQGPLGPTLLAACVLPGVLAPRVIAGRVHVDGGTINMLPVRMLRSQSPGPIIAVNVDPWDPIEMPDGDYPVGLGALIARWKGRAPPLSALQVFWRAVSFGGAQRANEEVLHADLMICPKVGTRSFADLGAFDELEAAGHEAAVEIFQSPRGRALRR